MYLGIQGQSKNLKKSLMKSGYEEFQERELQQILDEKDLHIRRLEHKIERLEKTNYELLNKSNLEGGANNYYKDKLAQQIKSNDIAVNLLLNISHKMNKTIVMLRESAGFNQQSTQVKQILNIMGYQSQSSNLDSSVYSDEDSSLENIASINQQVQKISEQLYTICAAFHQNYLKMQKQRSSLEKKMLQQRKISSQQISNLSKELKTARLGRQKLKQILQKNQNEKNILMNQIAAILTPDYKKSLDLMDRTQLINEIKRIMFKNKQLEISKGEVIKQNLKIKSLEMEKYRKMLNQVKEVKEMSRLMKTSF